MKKILILTLVLLFTTGLAVANAYTVYFGIDETLDFSLVNGFGIEIDAPMDTLTFEATFQNEKINIPGTGEEIGGSVPNQMAPGFPWDFFATTVPNGISAYDASYGTFQLIPGIVLTITGGNSFSITDVIIANNNDPNGEYPHPVRLLPPRSVDNGVMMFVASEVPIPGALYLLGSGILGLIGIGRRMKRS